MGKTADDVAARLTSLTLVLLAALALGVGCDGGGGSGDGDGGLGPDGGGPGPDGGALPDLSAELYDPDVVPTFALELPPASVDALNQDPLTYVTGTLRYGAEVVENIGVRLKGEYTFRPLDRKSSFKLKFDEFVPGQEFHGLKRMTFNNTFEDPSWVAERLTYHTYRAAQLPAPRANSAWITVNGEAYGLYTNLETEDKRFLARWFADNGGNLYEERMSELVPGGEDAFELETNELANDRSDLVGLITALDQTSDATFMADLAGVLDLDAFLRYCAYEAVVWQWDGYCYTRFGPNNFRLYHEPTLGKFYFLPWGMDMSLKPYEQGLDVFDARGLLFQRCLASDACRASYRTALAAAADLVEGLDLPGRVDAWGAQVRPHVADDPRAEHDVGEFDATLATVREVAAGRVTDLRDQLAR
ncbi:MAG: CotH kinase family protein [Kofleriaceae bacterium]|nr:CotH kinase family protein [Kofleriaceae bacterium]